MDRRLWLGLAGGASLTGLGAAAYRTAPQFWQQYAREWQRGIQSPPYRPDPASWPNRGLHGAWLGHSTVLLKVDGVTLITDPVFSDRVGIGLGPITLGVKRLVAPALDSSAIPRVDTILLSHAHFDHLDVPTLRHLEDPATEVIAAPQTSDLLRAGRYERVRELPWGGRAQAGPLSIRSFEVNHWGARMRTDTYRGYNGYVIDTMRYRILFAGDTAWTDTFRSVHSSRQVDVAIMPIGAYNPWIRYHCTPEQAWKMGNQAGAELFVPVHHQTFQLSREPYLEPISRFHDAAGSAMDRVLVSRIGQEFHL